MGCYSYTLGLNHCHFQPRLTIFEDMTFIHTDAEKLIGFTTLLSTTTLLYCCKIHPEQNISKIMTDAVT